MDITAFIRELLFGHDCVIIPSFGGFIANYTPARVDKATSTFYPPVKQILFNRNLNHNDGLLVGRISGHLKINYGDARNIVEEFVANLKRKLEKGERVVIDHVGTFLVNNEGSIQFEPEKSVNYYLDSYGLESFQFPMINGYDARKRLSGRFNREPMRREGTRKVLWRAAVIIPLLAALVAVPFKTSIFKSKVEATTLNPLAAAEFESNKPGAGSPADPVPVKPADVYPVPGNEGLTVLPAAAPVAGETTDNMVYCLITGSFKERENADAHARRLKEEGYSSEILTSGNGFFRVSAMRCTSFGSAMEKRESLAKRFPGAWVKRI